MRVLICGGKDVGRAVVGGTATPNNRDVLGSAINSASVAQKQIFSFLDDLHSKNGFTAVITDGTKGAAALGRLWASRNALPLETITARRLVLFTEGYESVSQRLFVKGQPDTVVVLSAEAEVEPILRRAKVCKIPVVKYSP